MEAKGLKYNQKSGFRSNTFTLLGNDKILKQFKAFIKYS
jgi:hypothetical protein